MSEKETASDNEYILAALAYFPFVSIFLLFSSFKKQYYIKYHAGHAFISYTLSLIIFVSYVALYLLFKSFMKDSFFMDMTWGMFFSIHLIVNFIFCFYCSLQAYQGRYIIVFGLTKLYYLLFNR